GIGFRGDRVGRRDSRSGVSAAGAGVPAADAGHPGVRGQVAGGWERWRRAGEGKEWILDLKGIALQIQQEQLQMQALLQALHGFAVNTLQQSAPPTAPAMQSMPAGAPSPHGGVLSRFMGGNFGQAMTQGVGLGAGFGLAD